MPDPTDEEQLISIRNLYEEICREADEDGERDDVELALIARVGKKIEELEAKIRSQQADEVEDEDYPEKETWEGWQFLRTKLQKLYDDLLDNDHPLAHGLGAILDEIKEAEAKTEYKRATKLLTESALKFVETHDLWNALEPVEDEEKKTNLLPELTLQLIEKLKTLRRELDRADHEKADEFGALVDKIPAEVPDFSSIMPAANAVGAAAVFATKHSLWEEMTPLPKSEEEALFWKNNGERYRRLQNLQRSLENTSQEFAPRLTEKIREIDKQINTDNFYLAGAMIDETWELAKKHDMIDEGPKDIWEGLGQDIAKLRELGIAAKVQDGMRDEGYEHADVLIAYLDTMKAAEAALEWQQAVDAYKAGRAYADKHDMWDETNVYPPEEPEDDDDTYPEKSRWENWQFLYDKMRKLYDQLSDMEHPLADRVGAYLDEIDEAAKKKEYQRATDLLVKDAGVFVTDNDLWDAVKTDDSDDKNLLPDLTLQQIKKLKDLARELKRMDHDHSDKFAALVDAIPDVVTDFSGIIPAGRAIGDAWAYADANKLWEAVPPLPKGEEEKIFWETNGKQFRALNTLHRNLEAAGHDMAARLGEKLAEVDEAISGDHFHLAMIHLDAATTLADDHKLWDAASASDDEDDGWLARLTDLDELKSLVSQLVSGGVDGAAEFMAKIGTILKEAAKGNFDTAGALLDTALARARELAASHDIGGGGGGETINPSTASISASVGKGGKNRPADVKTVQMLLNHHGASLKTDSDCGKLTIGAIEKFQSDKFGWKDGKVDPGGKTFGALTGTLAIEEIAQTAGEIVRDASKAAKDAAEAVVDAVGDAVEGAGEFFSDLFDGDDDDDEKKT